MPARVILLAFLAAFAQSLAAAPITFQELDFLVRQHTSDDEIVKDVAQRKLIAPLDDKATRVLKQNGATDALLERLRGPEMALSPEETRAAIERTMAHKARTQAAAQPAPGAPNAAPIPGTLPPAVPIMQQLEGKLVKLDGDMLKPYSVRELDKVRVYAFYYSAMWCGPCRKFTPTLIAAYNNLKAQHPEFELIFVSNDRDEFNMGEYMRSHKMPFPAVRFEDAKVALRQYSGSSIPWLVCVSDTGHPLTTNGKDKKYLPPEEVWNAIPSLLGMVRR